MDGINFDCTLFVEDINRTVSTLREEVEKIRANRGYIRKENLDSIVENVQIVRAELNKVVKSSGVTDLVEDILAKERKESCDVSPFERRDDPVKPVGVGNERSSAKVMATDDSMSDDVFESEDSTLRTPGTAPATQPSPTGYRGYKPPADLFKDPYEQEQELPHKTILLGDSGVGKTSLLVQFDTGKFQTGTFSATVGIGFTEEYWI